MTLYQRKVTVTVFGQAFEAELKPDSDTRAGVARAYVHDVPGADDISGTEILEGFVKLAGAPGPFTKRGEFPLVDKAWDALNSHIIARKTEVLKEALAALGDTDADATIKGAKFSAKAGCSCGCSPGFKVPGLPRRTNLFVSKVQA